MENLKFAILGAGSCGQTMAADLTLAGHDVNLFETGDYREYIRPIIELGGIEYTGLPSAKGRSGFAEINMVTSNISEAIEGVDIINFVLPANRHESLMNLVVPHLENGQIVVFWPDNWGSIRLRKMLEARGDDVNIIASGTASSLHACRRVTPNRVWVRRVKVNLRLSAYPKEDTSSVLKKFDEPWPGRLIAGENILEVTMTCGGWITHPPLMIFNACRIESDKGMFNIWEDGGQNPSSKVQSPSKLKGKIQDEIMAIMGKIGLRTDFPPVYPPGHAKAYLTEQELEEYSQIELPGVPQANPELSPYTFDHRYITEEIPIGLIPVHELGLLLGIPTPFTDATITIAGLLVDKDYWNDDERITLEKIGFDSLTPDEILNAL